MPGTHVVLAHLYAGHKAEDTVLENQHQGGGESCEACKKRSGRFVDDDRHGHYGHHYPQDTQNDVEHSLQWQIALVAAQVYLLEHKLQHSGHAIGESDDGIHEHKLVDDVHPAAVGVESEGHHAHEHKRRNEVGTLLDDTLLQDFTAHFAVAQPHDLAHGPHHGVTHREPDADGYAHYDDKIHYLLERGETGETAAVEQLVDMADKPYSHFVGGNEICCKHGMMHIDEFLGD